MTNGQDDSETLNARLLAAITRLNAAAGAHATSPDTVFTHALDLLLEVSGVRWGAIAAVQSTAGGKPRLRPLAASAEGGAGRLAALARARGLDADFADSDAAGAADPAESLELTYGGALVGLAAFSGGCLDAADLAPLAGVLAGLVAAETARAERDLQAERAQLAVAGSDAAIWDWDIKADTVWWSNQLKAMVGVPDDFEPDFAVILDRIHPEDRDTFTGAVEATLQRDAPYRTTVRLAREDGSYATIRTSGRLVRDAAGAPERLVGVQIDVSREAGLEQEMAQTGAMIEIAGAAGLATWRWDTERNLFYFDDRLCAMLDRPGMAGRAIAADEMFTIVHPDDVALVSEELDRVRQRRRHVFREEHRVLAPDGRVIWLRAHGGLIAEGLIVGVVEDRTAAKQAELELAAAKERYDLAVGGSLIAVWDWDVETGDLYWSDRFLEVLGLSRAEFTGRFEEFASRLHPVDQPRVEAALQAHIEHGEPYDIELRMRHADGRWVTLQARGAGRPGEDGRRTRMAGSILDVSAEREAQQLAADAALKVALAARHAGIGPIEIDLEAGEMRGDASLGRLVGRPGADRITLEHAMAIIHPEDAAAVAARRRELAEGRLDHLDTTHRIVRPDGSVAWTHTVAMVTRRSESGAAARLSGVIIDQTERREAERALAVEKERYDLAVSGSHMAIWDQNLITGEVYWSPRFGEILGYGTVEGHETREQFAARIHPDDIEQARRDFRAMVERGAPYDVTVRLRRLDGGYVHVRSRGGVLRDEAGRPVRVCGSLTDVTEEMLARARADLALSAAPLGIWDWDLTTGLMTADARLANMFGRPELAEQSGPSEAPLEFVHPEDRPAVRRWLDALKAGRAGRMAVEHRVVKPDGAVVWVGGNASVVEFDAAGAPRRILGVFEDRTVRKSAELEIAEAKRRYDVAVTGAHAAIWDLNLETGELYWSARLGEMLGLGARERTETLDEFVARTHPDDVEKARKSARRAIETGEVLDNILRVRRADGVYRHLRSRAGMLYDDSGRAVRMCGSITDATDEIEAEAKARLSGRRAELALEAAHLGVWDYDAETGSVTLDATLASMLGDPDLAGRALTQDAIMGFTHADDLDEVRADLARLHRRERNSVYNEHRIVRPDGKVIWVRADVGVAERAPDGSAARMIGIVQDLSGVKLTENLLRKSAEAARQASEAKSQFLATMSHEIRTPLNGVLGVVQLLERTELDPRQKRYVDTIKASGRSLADVIEDVLDISRIEAGRLQLKPEPSMVAEMLDRACAPSRALAAQKGVDLNLTISGDLTEPVMVDPRRVAQMVGNLIGNAVKFTDQGGVRVRATRRDKAVLRIEVDDDGPGLPEDMHEAVFERFTQADMSNSRAHEGAGLGLAIVRELAQLAGGVAGVRSRPGEGACFWIEVPAPAAARRPAAPRATAPDVGTALRVLVVEDHPTNRAVTAELVTDAGHVCDTAESGEAALRALNETRFDLVLLDLHMPDMDGAQTLAHIRRGDAGPADLPVYMVTADATPEARAKTLALGANGFFVKPLDSAALRRVLSTAANSKRSAG